MPRKRGTCKPNLARTASAETRHVNRDRSVARILMGKILRRRSSSGETVPDVDGGVGAIHRRARVGAQRLLARPAPDVAERRVWLHPVGGFARKSPTTRFRAFGVRSKPANSPGTGWIGAPGIDLSQIHRLQEKRRFTARGDRQYGICIVVPPILNRVHFTFFCEGLLFRAVWLG